MKWAFLDSREDLDWLRDVHIPGLSQRIKSAVIEGNEDFPDRILLYEKREPSILDTPIVYVQDPHSYGRYRAAR